MALMATSFALVWYGPEGGGGGKTAGSDSSDVDGNGVERAKKVNHGTLWIAPTPSGPSPS
jgi:hypothetical protein